MKMFKTLDDLSPQGKIILLRADLNVPMQNKEITDTTRLDRIVPTLKELSDKGARVVILSHFGRPKGKSTPDLSLSPIATALEKATNHPISFATDCIGDIAKDAIDLLKDGDILLLENVRFHVGEEKNDAAFAEQIAALGDVYVNDAFSTAHRAHATTHGITKFLPAYAGRLMQAELDALSAALGTPVRPVTAFVGGAKISTKIDLLNNLVTKIDTLVLGGGMANTFLHATGMNVGKSLCEKEMAETAQKIIATAAENNCKIILPIDGVTAKEFKANPVTETRGVDNIDEDDLILDIGKGTVAIITDILHQTKTLLWNGPMGAFETPPFDTGTVSLAKVAATLTQEKSLISVAGGGDTVAALSQAGVTDQITYISTAGGAFLEWLEGKELPGVQALIAQNEGNTQQARVS